MDNLHEPSAAFFDLPSIETPFMRITRERAAAGQQPWPWPKSGCITPGGDVEITNGFVWLARSKCVSLDELREMYTSQAPCTDWLGMQPEAKKPEPGFDSEAHAKFMRSLG